MKKLNIKILLICSSLVLFLSSCNKNKNEEKKADKYSSLIDLRHELEPEIQSFSVDPTTSQTVRGKDGTVISIEPNAFIDSDGNSISTPITIKLKEHLTLEDMVLANVQTSSDNQLLVTGGSFNLTFKDENGTDVDVSKGKMSAKISVKTDITDYKDQMRYYKGIYETVDGKQKVNWTQGDSKVSWFDDEDMFNMWGIVKGLTNCDALYEIAYNNTPTQFEVKVPETANYTTSLEVWMIIKDFPSVISITQLNQSSTALKTYDTSIPTGLNATLVAIYIDENNYLKFGSLPITVSGDDVFTIDVDFGTTEQLKSLLQRVTS